MNIIFAGTPVFAARHLELLIAHMPDTFNICAVYTQPDRPSGRGKKLTASPVKQLALENGLTIKQPQSLKTEQAQAELASLTADLMIVVAYGLILPEQVLETPRLGCINVHGSILPRWRGAAPIQRAIQAGDTSTGVTIMQMDKGLDTGDMLLKAHCPISQSDNSASLHDTLCELGPPALIETIELIRSGRAVAEKQDDSLANYATKIDKAEAKLDWKKSAELLDREIRAFNPFPISYSEINGERVKIHQASVAKTSATLAPGELLIKEEGLLVGCGDGVIEIQKIQMPGKKTMPIQDYLNGIAHTLPAQHFDIS